MIYDKDGRSLSDAFDLTGSLDVAYDVNGNIVFQRSGPSQQWDYTSYTVSSFFNYPQTNLQGFAVYGNTIAQVREGDSLKLIDLDTKTLIRSVSMNMGHGNSCQFDSVFYNPSDEFPLFYVRNDGIWIYRITGTSSTLIKKLSFSADIVGTYVAGFGIDTINRKMYTASYTEGDYQTRTGRMRICEFDLTDETDNGDGTFSVGLLRSNDFDWFNRFEAVQGCDFHDGYLFIASGYTSGNGQNIVLISSSTLGVDYTVNPGGWQELEGCAWVNNDYLLVGQRISTYSYKKITFAPL